MLVKEFITEEKDEVSQKDIFADIIKNFKKITGVDIKTIFNKQKGDGDVDDAGIFNDKVITKTFSDIKKYVKDKYDIDVTKEKNFLENFDEKLSSIYPY